MSIQLTTYDSHFIPKSLITDGNISASTTDTTLSIVVPTVLVTGDAAEDINVEQTGLTFTISAGGKGVNSYIMNNTANNGNIEEDRTAYGYGAGGTNQGASSVAVGSSAGGTNQGSLSVATGSNAGQTNQGTASVAVGSSAGSVSQGSNAVAVGENSAQNLQGTDAVALGSSAGRANQGSDAVAVGTGAGQNYQASRSVCVGKGAGNGVDNTTHMGVGAIAVGTDCAAAAAVPAYSISFGDSCSPPGAIGRIGFGNNMESLASTASAGVNGAVPAQVAGYLIIEHNGTAFKCPLFNM